MILFIELELLVCAQCAWLLLRRGSIPFLIF